MPITTKSEKGQKRKSVLDILKLNFSLHERNTFVHRLIYIGNFVCNEPASEDKPLMDGFRRTVKTINDRYFDEKLTGLLLLYNQHFCHLLEGSEESIVRFLTLMYENDILKDKLGASKLLVIYHHVNQRIIEDWIILTATTNAYFAETEDSLLVQKKDTLFFKKHCIEKLYLLGLSLRQSKIPEQHEDVPSRPISRRKLKGKAASAKKDPVIKVSVFLPELDYVKNLLVAPNTYDLKYYLEIYDKINYLDVYEEVVWPVPCEYMPMHTFNKEIDPIAPLPSKLND
ncbi:hypothetical protein QE152_g30409 [Popillia japonica]|uniref:BLUF domain-containing protein n=1 Tax=Popillia japonica TaxID=7064 RepID=A0AAW1JEE8_POPJA